MLLSISRFSQVQPKLRTCTNNSRAQLPMAQAFLSCLTTYHWAISVSRGGAPHSPAKLRKYVLLPPASARCGHGYALIGS